ncbi:MAG: M3 family oligoendopeptidase [Defluviitaleaceae bacterium]|nr:M3 family oligoendopeptidase [Defluviitaleaceae bacterium]
MKFTELEYVHLEYKEVSEKLSSLIDNFKNSTDVNEAVENYNKVYEYLNYFKTMFALSYIRNSLDTTNEYYSKELAYGYEIQPKIESIFQEMTVVTLESPFRKELEEKWGSLLFINEELALKTVSPEVIEELQKENKLVSEYDKLMASAKVEFDGKVLNISQMGAYLENKDRDVRKNASNAIANWFLGNKEKFDNIFIELKELRTNIAKKLGYENFVELAYYRRKRNCYDSKMVAEFRKGVLEHIVPVITKLKAMQAKRIGVDSLKIYDANFKYLDGNPAPTGTEQELLAHTKKMYEELDPLTGKFFNMMLDNELLDVTTRQGKNVGGYCYTLTHYKMPFIFANFNGTAADVVVLTHEAGHAFASFMSKDIMPTILQNYTFDIAEIHSMSMEFFTWDWMNGFFGKDTDKYYESHLEKALVSIAYGSIVDEFQHGIYEKPEMSIEEINKSWLSLESKYRPWLDLDNSPFYGEGRAWQGQLHIYNYPFYYIDYCLAQVVALYFWAEKQENHSRAW